MPRPHQVPASVFAGPHQVPGGFLGLAGHPHPGQLPDAQQPRQALGVPAIGLDLVSGGGGVGRVRRGPIGGPWEYGGDRALEGGAVSIRSRPTRDGGAVAGWPCSWNRDVTGVRSPSRSFL